MRTHFLPDSLQDLKQSPIFFPSQVFPEPDALDDDESAVVDFDDFDDGFP